MADNITKKMLNTIREGIDKTRVGMPSPSTLNEESYNVDNFLRRSEILMEEAEKKSPNDDKHQKRFPITKKTPQFGDVRVSQEESLIKTVGEQVKLNDESLIYYPDADDLTFEGEMPSLNTTFQFKYNDSSGQGIYVWCDGLQMTEENYRTIGKLRDAFVNWKSVLVRDGDLMDKLKKVAEKQQS